MSILLALKDLKPLLPFFFLAKKAAVSAMVEVYGLRTTAHVCVCRCGRTKDRLLFLNRRTILR